MLIATHHDTILGLTEAGEISQLREVGELAQAVQVETAGQLPHAIGRPTATLRDFAGGFFWASDEGAYLCAEAEGPVRFNRAEAREWETFKLVPEFYARSLLGDDARRFAARVAALRDQGAPIKIQMACGLFPAAGFLNIDLEMAAPDFMASNPDDYFIFPTVGHRIPLAGGSADYIFHEDFFEHIGQLEQIQFLAETLRILKPGGIHRINTPDLLWTMRTRSDFGCGYPGVYTGERQWDHVSIMTRRHLEEIALMVGYGAVHFNARGKGISPYAIADRRPFDDRDETDGNIFADLVK